MKMLRISATTMNTIRDKPKPSEISASSYFSLTKATSWEVGVPGSSFASRFIFSRSRDGFCEYRLGSLGLSICRCHEVGEGEGREGTVERVYSALRMRVHRAE